MASFKKQKFISIPAFNEVNPFFILKFIFLIVICITQYLLTDPYPPFKLSYPNMKKRVLHQFPIHLLSSASQSFHDQLQHPFFRITQFETLFSSWSDYIFPIFLSRMFFSRLLTTHNDENLWHYLRQHNNNKSIFYQNYTFGKEFYLFLFLKVWY